MSNPITVIVEDGVLDAMRQKNPELIATLKTLIAAGEPDGMIIRRCRACSPSPQMLRNIHHALAGLRREAARNEARQTKEL